MQTIIVYLIVALAIFFAVRGIWRIVRPLKTDEPSASPCCGCKGCPSQAKSNDRKKTN